MNHLFKRTLSLVVAVVMVLAMIPANPVHVRADSTTAIDGFLMNLQGKTGATATSELIGNEWTYYDSLADMSLYVQNKSANAYKWQVKVTPYKINADGSANKLMDPVMLHEGNVPANMTSAIDLLAGKLSDFNSLITSKGNGRYGLVVTIKDAQGNQVLEQPYYFSYTNQSVFVDLVKTDGSEGLVLGPDEKCDLTLMIKNKGGNKTVSAKYVGTKGTQSATYDITTNYALAQGKELSISLNTSALGHCTAEGEYSIEVTITNAKGTVGANTFTVTREAAPATEVTVATLDELLEALADDSNDLPIVVTETIVIDKALTIDGNGATVKFDAAASAFVIKSSDVTIQDMTIVQGAKDNSFHISVDKGAWDAPAIQYSNITIENIVFQGGDYALCLIGENVVVDGCTFTEQDSHNILVYSLKGDSKIINNTFNASKGNNKSAILYEGGVSTTLTGDDLAAFMGGGNLTISGNEAYNKGVFFQFTNWGLVEGMEVEISDNLVDGTTNKVIALYTETPSVASGEEFASFVVSENAFINTAAGRTIIKEYTGKIAVDMTGNYLGSATPNLGALLVGNLVSCDAYYATYENGILGEYVSTKPAVASVNGVGYETFAKALEAAQTGDTITVLENVTLTDTLVVPANKTISLDLNGKSVNTVLQSGSTTKHILALSNYGTLTVKDTSAEQKGSINSRGIENYGTMTMESGTLIAIDGDDGYSVYNKQGATFTMNGGELKGLCNVNANKVALYNEGTAIIHDGKIHSERETIRNYGTMTINGGEFSNSVEHRNGAHVVRNHGELTVNGGVFNEKDEHFGCALYVAGGKVTINGGTFNGTKTKTCTAASCGHGPTNAAVAVSNDGQCEILGGNFDYGVYFATTPGLVIKGGTWTHANNVAPFVADGYQLKDNGDDSYSVIKHTCSYTSKVTTPPTTTSKGVMTYECECGDSYTEAMDVLPQAIVTDKGATTYVGSYYTFDVNTGKINSAEGGINLPKTLVFTAQEEGEAAENNYYASYNTDFYVKLDGLSADSVKGTGCYLAGYYEAYELWVVIPLDAVDIQNGLAYPLLAIAGQDFSYEMICNGVKEFTCGLYLSDEFLAANPNVQVTVDLGLREEQIKDLGELANLEYFQSEGFEYDKDDLDAELVAMVNGVKYYTLAEAAAAAQEGEIVELLADNVENIELAKAIELKLNGKSYTGTITLAEGATLTAPEGLDVTTNVADHKVFYKDGAYVAYEKVELPQVAITDVKGDLLDSDPDLTFALNFAIANMDELTDEYLEKLFAFYGDYYTDYVLTISGLNQDSVTFNANGDADGYLAGQYDAWSENWVSVPFEDVTVRNGESLYIMEYAAKLMGQSGLRFTLAEVAAIVQNFDCGVYFTPEFLAANPGLQVTLELKVFTEDAEGNKIEDISVATNNFDVENVAAIVVGEDKQTRYFDSFTAAVAAAEAGDTVIMLEDATLSGKLTMSKNITIDGNGHSIIANHTSYILETSADCTFKDITLNTNGKAKGVKIASGNVVFDNVAIPNSNKSDAITVAGTLTLKNYFKVASSYTMIDARSGVVIAEPGTVFDMTTWRANVSPAKSDLTGAVKADGEPFFVAYGSTTYYTSLSSIATTITDLTLLADVDLPAKTLTVKGNLNLNGHDLVVKELKVAGATTIIGGAVTAEKLTLTSASATLTAPEGLNVTTTLEGYQVVCKDGVYTLIKAVASVNGVFYETFEEAWAAVQAGGTITLLTNYSTNIITVFENVTLDLNGHICTAAYVVVFNGGHIVDNSESNAGRLVAGNLMINEKNKQLPVKTDNGYMFVDVIKCNTAVQMDGAKFVFQPWIELTAHDQIKKGAEVSGVSVVVRVTYYVGTDKRVQDFIYSDELVNALLNSWTGTRYGSMLSLKLNGLENYSNISYECVLVSETGVELSYRPE